MNYIDRDQVKIRLYCLISFCGYIAGRHYLSAERRHNNGIGPVGFIIGYCLCSHSPLMSFCSTALVPLQVIGNRISGIILKKIRSSRILGLGIAKTYSTFDATLAFLIPSSRLFTKNSRLSVHLSFRIKVTGESKSCVLIVSR